MCKICTLHIANSDKFVKFYNLDVIISVSCLLMVNYEWLMVKGELL
ncbi:MAG: putative DNA-binding protein in cluster with Type I restriction-modification system [Candidatus Ruthia sp. Asou_11_S2]|nr:putative DNA-binding protein in cluster with Type I restriction-modification system [Candidatus Ruthia sp. Asou_11_S2]